jgi:hypothetical protein
MTKLLRFAGRRSGTFCFLVGGTLAGFAAFVYAINLDEGKKQHLRKQLAEAREMPLRLLT